MASSNLPAFRQTRRLGQLAIAFGLSALLQAGAADALHACSSPDPNPVIESAEDTRQMIRIKRLRPADPESREIMLADRGLSIAGRTSSLG